MWKIDPMKHIDSAEWKLIGYLFNAWITLLWDRVGYHCYCTSPRWSRGQALWYHTSTVGFKWLINSLSNTISLSYNLVFILLRDKTFWLLRSIEKVKGKVNEAKMSEWSFPVEAQTIIAVVLLTWVYFT